MKILNSDELWVILYLDDLYNVTIEPFSTGMGVSTVRFQVGPIFPSKQSAYNFLQLELTGGESEGGLYEIVKVEITKLESVVFKRDPDGPDPGQIGVKFAASPGGDDDKD